MRSFLTILILFAFVLPMKAQLSLEECHEKARLNYPLIKQFELIENSTEYTLSNANKAYLPQLSITAVGGIIDGFPEISLPGTEASSSNDFQLLSIIQFNQVLWDGGTTKARKEMARAKAEIEKSDVEVNLYALRERVNNIYFGILLIDEQSSQLKIYHDNLERNHKMVESLVENGSAYQSDLDEVEFQLLSSEQKLQELEYNRKAYVEMLAVFIGEEIGDDVELSKPSSIVINSEQEINRPEIQMFEERMNLLASQDQSSKSRLYPKIGLLGFGTFFQPGLPFANQEIDRILVAGLSLSWDLTGVYLRGNDKKLNEVERMKIDNQKESFLFSTNLQKVQAEEEINKLSSLVEQDEQMLVLRERIRKSYESKYENGAATMNEVLTRINDENLARQNLAMHDIQHLMATYQYQTITGN